MSQPKTVDNKWCAGYAFGGSPGSAFPIQSRGDSVRLPARRQPPQGMGPLAYTKSVPEQIVSVMSFARFWRAVSPAFLIVKLRLPLVFFVVAELPHGRRQIGQRRVDARA